MTLKPPTGAIIGRGCDSTALYLLAALEFIDPAPISTAWAIPSALKGWLKPLNVPGLGQTKLDKALIPDRKPRFETILKGIEALGNQILCHASQNTILGFIQQL